MSTENKNIVEDIQRSLNTLREKADNSADKAELVRLENHIDAQVKSLQEAMAAANAASAAANVDMDDLEKQAVAEYFTKGDRALDRSVNGRSLVKAVGDQVSLTTPAEGGILLPRTYGEMVDALNRKTSTLRSLAKVVNGGMGYTVPIKLTQTDADIRGELGAIHESKAPTYDVAQPTFFEVNAEVPATVWSHQGDTAPFDIVNFAIQDVLGAMGEKESMMFMLGTQQNTYTGNTVKNGLLQQAALHDGTVTRFTNEFGTVAGVECAGASASLDDVLNLLDVLHGRYDPTILAGREFRKGLLTLKDANGNYILTMGNVQSGGFPQVWGVSIVAEDYFDDETTPVGAPIALAGDFRQAVTIVDASPIAWVVDPYTDKRFVKYLGRRRTSSMITNYNAIRGLYKKSS